MAHKAHRPHNFRALSKPKKLHKREHKHYLPYIPLLLLMVGTFLVSLGQPLHRTGVLAYATNVNSNGLLDATNNQRQQKGVSTLQPSSALSTAAQAKANDMIARNYWSHTTPDGQQPWIFMDNAGYKYQKAGENLAYGFLTSSETVTGWMNSQTHRDNLLDATFTEVGFGFANGEDFNSSGQETVVVAMYGKPQVLASSNQSPIPPPTTVAPQSRPVQPPSQTPSPAAPESVPVATAAPTAVPITTDTPVITEPASKQVARIQTLTKGRAPWALFAIGLLGGMAIMLLLIKHAAGLRHLIRDSERFVLHHPLLDAVLIGMVLVSSFMSQTTGFIR